MDNFHLSRLKISNFRNIADDIFNFEKGINCIFGPNGNGKTNLLEAISIITNKKSFKKNVGFAEMLSIDGDQPEISFSTIFSQKEKPISFSGKINKEGEELYLENKPTKKRIGVHSLFINPFESYLFHNNPTFRKGWIDQYFSILSQEYKKIIGRLKKQLRARNELLGKKPVQWQKQIQATNLSFAQTSIELIEKRLFLLKKVNEKQGDIFQEIFDERHELEFFYQTKFNHLNPQKIVDFYQENLEKDAAIGYTHYGVQRDDYFFEFDGINSFNYCSLGQQKMAYLSLIFSFLEIYNEVFETYPLVLIDDVSGELDEKRWKQLVQFLEKRAFQVFITTANEHFKKELEKLKNANKIYIKSGSLFRLN